MSEVVLTTYTAISPLIHYAPAYDVETTSGWRTTCVEGEQASAIGPESYFKVECIGGDRNARRSTSTIGASVTFEFYGEGAEVYGSAVGTFSTYSVDSQPSYQVSDTSGNGHLFGLAGLTKGWHTLVLTLAYNGASSGEVAELSITRVEFDAGQRSDQMITFAPALLSTTTWTFTSAPETMWWPLHNVFRNSDGSDSNRTQDGVLTRLPGARAELKFRASSISIIGDILFDHGLYSVSLFPTNSPSTSTSPPYRTLNLSGKSNYTFAEALLFFASGLDASIEHTVVVENKAEDFLDIVTAVLVGGPKGETVGGSGNPGANSVGNPGKDGSSPAKSDLPTIIGATVGGALAVLLGIIAVFILIRRKRQLQRQRERRSHFPNLSEPWPPASSTLWTPPASSSLSSTPLPSSPVVQPFVADFEQSRSPEPHPASAADQSSAKARAMVVLGKNPRTFDLASGRISGSDAEPVRQVDRMAKLRVMEVVGKSPMMFEERTWTAAMASGSGSGDRRREREVEDPPFSVTGTLPPAYSS